MTLATAVEKRLRGVFAGLCLALSIGSVYWFVKVSMEAENTRRTALCCVSNPYEEWISNDEGSVVFIKATLCVCNDTDYACESLDVPECKSTSDCPPTVECFVNPNNHVIVADEEEIESNKGISYVYASSLIIAVECCICVAAYSAIKYCITKYCSRYQEIR